MTEDVFTFFFDDGSEAPPAFELGYFVSLEAARQRAVELLAERRRYTAIEIFDGQTSVRVQGAVRSDPGPVGEGV